MERFTKEPKLTIQHIHRHRGSWWRALIGGVFIYSFFTKNTFLDISFGYQDALKIKLMDHEIFRFTPPIKGGK